MSPQGTVSAPRRVTFGFVATLTLIVAGLAAADRALDQLQNRDLASSAERAYQQGLAQIGNGDDAGAVASLRTAHATERDNREYELELIVALMGAGRTADAEALMTEALQAAPNDGRTNLIAARLANEENRSADATAFYHRAVYGEWPNKASDHRIAVRMELIGFLREKGTRPEVLAELISLEAEAPQDKAMQLTLAHLMLSAGAPARAADIYRSLVDQDSRNAAAQAGLGEAELEQGRYREAHQAFVQAFFHSPTDTEARSKLQLLNTVMALDPTPRDLSAAEKFRRSLRILQLARDSLGQCVAKSTAAPNGDQDPLMAQADQALAAAVPARVTNELAEQNLNLAQKLWQSRVKSCGGIPPSEDALKLIMDKLAGS